MIPLNNYLILAGIGIIVVVVVLIIVNRLSGNKLTWEKLQQKYAKPAY